MCRSIIQGGRRCNHDDSNARALRRANARLKHSFQNSVVDSGSSAETVSAFGVKASQDFKAAVKAVHVTRDAIKDMMSNGYSWNGEVNGEKFDSYHDAYNTLLARMEVQVREAGAAIDSEVEARTGVTFSSIAEYAKTRQDELSAELDRLIELEKKYKEEAVEKYGVSTFLPLDGIRMKFKDNPDDEGLKDFVERIDKLTKDSDETRRLVFNFKTNNDEKLFHMWNDNRSMLKTVLNEVRDFGSVKLEVDATSDKRKALALQNVMDVYPSEWIEASNNNDAPLRVKKTVGRAHYNRNAGQVKVVPAFVFVTKDKDFEPNGTRFESGWVKLEPDEDGLIDYRDEATGTSFQSVVGKTESMWIKPQLEYANLWNVGSNGTPRGRGWETADVLEKKFNSETGEYEMTTVTMWRRQVKEKRIVGESKAELLVDGSRGRLVTEEGYDSAVHEFAHRVEDSKVPLMKEMQDKFYRRRTEVDGTPMEKVRLYKGRKEFAIPDDFTADYMGKRYEQQQHFEVLSTGMEAVFGNSYGGLVGLAGKKPDYDMRNFIVGMLVSV